MGGMRPASAASEAIEAEVSLKVWDVLHGTLRWALEADGPRDAGLCDLRGHLPKAADCELSTYCGMGVTGALHMS